MASEKQLPGPTPNGGAYAMVYFLDGNRQAVDEEEATNAEIVEFDDDDQEINRTYGSMTPAGMSEDEGEEE